MNAPADQAPGPLLEVEGLRVAFVTRRGLSEAVRGVSLTLGRGEVVGIVGESGSGKSVTGLSLMRLLPEAARIVGGSALLSADAGPPVDLLALDERALSRLRGRRIGMVFQDPMTALNPYLTIERQLTEVLERHEGTSRHEARARAVRMLERVGIADASQRIFDHPHKLSGGMRQRVMIAMTLLAGPDLIVADEPTTALDVTVQADVLALLRERSAEDGVSIVLITHDLGVVAHLAERVHVMYAGLFVETGPVGEVLTRPRHPYTAGLLRSLPSRALWVDGPEVPELVPIPGAPPRLGMIGDGCAFAPRCAHAEARCRTQAPLERAVGEDQPHTVRCHFDLDLRERSA